MTRRRCLVLLCAVALCALPTRGVEAAAASTHRTPSGGEAAEGRRTLDIYFIDVEGGAATLMVTPMGESILVDSGWRRDDDRDARRIHHVATQVAGLNQIDYAVTTYWSQHERSFQGCSCLAPG